MKKLIFLMISILILFSCKNNGKEELNQITKDSISVNYSGNLCSNDIDEIIAIIKSLKNPTGNLQVPLNDLKNVKIIGADCEFNLYPMVEEFNSDTINYIYAYTNIKQRIEKDFKNRKVNIFLVNPNDEEIVDVNRQNIEIEYSDTVLYE